MKKLLTLLLLTFFFYGTNAQNTNSKEKVYQVNSQQFKALIEKGNGTFLDVRTSSEYNAEHIDKSGQLNFYALDFKKKLLLLPKTLPVYLYCNTGYRSQKAAEILVKNGYKNVYNLEHGIMEWNLKELPVVEGDKSLLGKENLMSPDDYNELIASNTPVFIDFYAPWCGPCRKMMPMMDSLKTEYHGKIKIVKINADISKQLVKKLKLMGVPYLVLYKNNELLFEKSGMASRELLISEFKKYISEEKLDEDANFKKEDIHIEKGENR